jgi:hypothetical protein
MQIFCMSHTLNDISSTCNILTQSSSQSAVPLERFQWKALRMTVDATWYVPNTVIRRDLQTPTVKKKSAATALNTVLASAHTQKA